MPHIEIKLLAGRTNQQKRDLARALSDATVATLGISVDRVSVIIEDVLPTEWMRGGLLYSEKLELND